MMNKPFNYISSLLLIHFFTVCPCRGIRVNGFEGQDVTLPCKYNSHYYGKCEICWMKGAIPSSGCGSEIIATDVNKVVRKTSDRYHLTGDLRNGDVSLTIRSAKQHDSGKYGCRVHVPGWFNDLKVVVHLVIAQESPLTVPVNTDNNDNVTMGLWDHSETLNVTKIWNSANYSITSLPEHSKNVIDTMDMFPGIAVSVLLCLIILGTVAIYLMWKQKRKNRTTADQHQNTQDTIIYSNSDNSVGLQNRAFAVDNIYQLDTENEYERWS